MALDFRDQGLGFKVSDLRPGSQDQVRRGSEDSLALRRSINIRDGHTSVKIMVREMTKMILTILVIGQTMGVSLRRHEGEVGDHDDDSVAAFCCSRLLFSGFPMNLGFVATAAATF